MNPSSANPNSKGCKGYSCVLVNITDYPTAGSLFPSWGPSAPANGHVEPGQNVTTVFDNGSSIIFEDVDSAGEAAVSKEEPGQPAPEQFRFTQNGYYEITMSGSYTGNITITLPYDPSLEGKENTLKIFHYKEPAGWEEVTPLSFDTTNHTVTFTVTSLSPFAIVEPLSSGGSSVPSSSAWSLILMGLIAVGVIRRSLKIKSC